MMPSDTGQPGGKKTGENVADYIIPGGKFEALCQELMQEVRITWGDRVEKALPTGEDGQEGEDGESGETEEKENKSNRIKYQCPKCKNAKGKPINAWGKPGLRLLCGECHSEFIEAA